MFTSLINLISSFKHTFAPLSIFRLCTHKRLLLAGLFTRSQRMTDLPQTPKGTSLLGPPHPQSQGKQHWPSTTSSSDPLSSEREDKVWVTFITHDAGKKITGLNLWNKYTTYGNLATPSFMKDKCYNNNKNVLNNHYFVIKLNSEYSNVWNI